MAFLFLPFGAMKTTLTEQEQRRWGPVPSEKEFMHHSLSTCSIAVPFPSPHADLRVFTGESLHDPTDLWVFQHQAMSGFQSHLRLPCASTSSPRRASTCVQGSLCSPTVARRLGTAAGLGMGLTLTFSLIYCLSFVGPRAL